MITEKVVYTPDCDDATNGIRVLFCTESSAENPPGRNPLTETDFNILLGRIAQRAFDEGRDYQQRNYQRRRRGGKGNETVTHG